MIEHVTREKAQGIEAQLEQDEQMDRARALETQQEVLIHAEPADAVMAHQLACGALDDASQRHRLGEQQALERESDDLKAYSDIDNLESYSDSDGDQDMNQQPDAQQRSAVRQLSPDVDDDDGKASTLDTDGDDELPKRTSPARTSASRSTSAPFPPARSTSGARTYRRCRRRTGRAGTTGPVGGGA